MPDVFPICVWNLKNFFGFRLKTKTSGSINWRKNIVHVSCSLINNKMYCVHLHLCNGKLKYYCSFLHTTVHALYMYRECIYKQCLLIFIKKLYRWKRNDVFFFTDSANSSVSASPAINRRQGSPEKAVKHAHQKDSGLGKILFNVESLQFMVAQIFFQFS